MEGNDMTEKEIRDAVIMGGYIGSKNAEGDLDKVKLRIRNLPRKAAENEALHEIGKESRFTESISDAWYQNKGIKDYKMVGQSLMEALTSQFFNIETGGLLHLSPEEIRDDVAILIRRLTMLNGLNSVYQKLISRDGRTAIAKEAHTGEESNPRWLQSEQGKKCAQRLKEVGLLKDDRTFNSDKWDLTSCAEMCQEISRILYPQKIRVQWSAFAPDYFGFSARQLTDAYSSLMNKRMGKSKAHETIKKALK